MIIGVPKEINPQENRVALLPSAVYQLTRRGHQVVVENGGNPIPKAQQRASVVLLLPVEIKATSHGFPPTSLPAK